jgi:hypothetical protein
VRLRSFLAKVLLTPLVILPLPLTIALIGMDTPLALADSINATASVTIPGCSQSATLSEPGSIDITCSNVDAGMAYVLANLGWSSGNLEIFGETGTELSFGKVNAEIDIAGEIMAPGNSGTSTITFGFEGVSSGAPPVGCSLTFEGETTDCTAPSNGIIGRELEFVVQNGQTYNFDLQMGFDQNLSDENSQTTANLQYSLPDVIPEPVPEPVSLVLLLSGFAPVVFRRSLWRS